MKETLATGLRRNSKKKSYAVNKKTLISVISLISVLSIILLLPVFSTSLLAYGSTLLSLCTLFLFGGIIVYLTIRLLMVVSDWLGSGKHAEEHTSFSNASRPIKNPLWWDLGGIAIVFLWAFILKLFYPFVTTLVWWQGYKLMGGKKISLGAVEGTVSMVECLTYFGIAIVLLLLSQFYWCYYSKRRRRYT